MLLPQWLQKHRITQTEFAAMMGVTQGRVSQICRTGRYSPDNAIIIDELTKGEVPCTETCPRIFKRKRRKVAA